MWKAALRGIFLSIWKVGKELTSHLKKTVQLKKRGNHYYLKLYLKSTYECTESGLCSAQQKAVFSLYNENTEYRLNKKL